MYLKHIKTQLVFMTSPTVLKEKNTTNQYAIGIYSRGEIKEMNAHSKRHTNLTGEYVSEMETCLAL